MRKFLGRLLGRNYIHFEYTSTGAGWFFDIEKRLHKKRTKYQKLEIVQTKEFGKGLLLDGITQLTFTQEYQYHEPMAHLPLLCHPKPKSVLIIGGGDGALLAEILKHPSVESVDFAELDGDVIKYIKTLMPELSSKAFDSPKVKIHINDGRAFAKSQAEKGIVYDAVFMDMTDPFGPSLALYSREFFEIIRSILKDKDSFFIMHSESPDYRPKTFAKIHSTLRTVFPEVEATVSHIRMYGGLWSWAICSEGLKPATVSKDTVEARIKERKLENLKIIDRSTWESFFALWPMHRNLLAMEIPPATDSSPEYPPD